MREEAEKREREETERVAAFLAAGGVAESNQDVTQPDGARSNQTSLPPSTVTHSDETVGETEGSLRDDGQTSDWTVTVPGEDDNQMAASMGALSLDNPPATHTTSEERSVTATNAQLAQVLPHTYQGPPPPTQNLTPMTPPSGNLMPPDQAPLASARTYQSIFSGPSAPQMAPPAYTETHPPPANPYYHSAGAQGAQIPPPMAPHPGMQYQAGYYHQQGYQPVPPPGGQYVTQYSNASSSSWGSVELPAPSYHMVPQATPPTQSKLPSLNPRHTSLVTVTIFL